MKIIQNPKKSLGQNFLIDKNILNKIASLEDVKNKNIIEIGAGYGNLTEEILNRKPKKIFAIEKDKEISKFLFKKFTNNKKIVIINDDILSFFKRKNNMKEAIVFGNLPYNISTKILANLILLNKWPPWYDKLIFMFQKEVADRIIAKSHTREFNRLSVLSNWRLEIKKNFDVSKYCFFPRPKINSTVLSFVPKKNNLYNLKNPNNIEIITRILFSNRRKKINKNFKKLFKKKFINISGLNIDLNKRPEELSRETFYRIALEYEKLFG